MMRASKYILTSSVFLAALSLTCVHADILAEYAFTGGSYASTDSEANTNAGDWTSGAGIPLATNGSSGNPAPSVETNYGVLSNGLSAAITDDDYYAFTLTPVSATVDFVSLDFDIFKTNGATSTVSANLFSSNDSYASAIGTATLVGSGESNSFLARSIDLSGLINIGDAITFRLYLDDGGGSNNANDVRLDNVILNGNVTVVPEASALIIGVLAGFLALRRRIAYK